MENSLWNDIWRLITRRGWLDRTHGGMGNNYWYEFWTKDQGVVCIKIYIFVYADGRIFIKAFDPSLEISRLTFFLEELRQLFLTFTQVEYNQENNVFSFHPKNMPRGNIVEVELAIDLCINAVKRYHAALNAAKQALLNSH